MSYKRKIITLDSMSTLARDWQVHGLKVVQCHGCFDLLHIGHIYHLSWARKQGDILLVTVTPDIEVQKGEGRPLFPEQLRAENLAALEFVSWVALDTHKDACQVLDLIQPDVYVKGEDVRGGEALQREIAVVERHKGVVKYSPTETLWHSTDILRIIKERL